MLEGFFCWTWSTGKTSCIHCHLNSCQDLFQFVLFFVRQYDPQEKCQCPALFAKTGCTTSGLGKKIVSGIKWEKSKPNGIYSCTQCFTIPILICGERMISSREQYLEVFMRLIRRIVETVLHHFRPYTVIVYHRI